MDDKLTDAAREKLRLTVERIERLEEEKKEEKKLNLTIFVKLDGFDLAASGATLDGSTAEPARPGERYFPMIDVGGQKMYDFMTLNKWLITTKKAFRREQSVIIVADPDVQYEDIVFTMDAARQPIEKVEVSGGRVKLVPEKEGIELFPAVAFSPGILG